MRTPGLLEAALDQLDVLGGHRVFLHAIGSAKDGLTLANALPWVVEGEPRPGVVMSVFARKAGLLIIAGGSLTEEDIAGMDGLRSTLGSRLKILWILPPEGTRAEVYDALARRSMLPHEPAKRRYHPAAVSGVGFAMVFMGLAFGRLIERSEGAFLVGLVWLFIAAGASLFLGGFIWESFRPDDPAREVAERWYPLSLMRR